MSTTATRWTEGPLHVEKHLHHGAEHADIYVMKGPATIAQMNGPCLLYANAEADAHLFAAAPAMAALLRFAAETLESDNGVTWLKAQARALLARLDAR